MVLFTEAETLKLLDTYATLRADAHNVTSGGVLLKLRARQELTLIMNQTFGRTPPWTESQVSVKFKNLRREYMELRWLTQQPGFQAGGAGMPDAWWEAIQAQRPKCHMLKGKLPWPFYHKMALISGDLQGDPDALCSPSAVASTDSAEQASAAKRENSIATSVVEERAQQQQQQQQQPFEAPGEAQHPLGDSADGVRASPTFHQKRRRLDAAAEATAAAIAGACPQESSRSDDRERLGSLARAVEQSSRAAAGMARGFQELIAVLQEHTARCRVLEQQAAAQGGQDGALTAQRSAVLAVAQSLEQSTRATTELAHGYRELVSQYVRETDRAVQRDAAS